MKVLVVGATGFLGRPILGELLGHAELVGAVSRGGSPSLPGDHRPLELRADLRIREHVRRVFTAEDWDVVVLTVRPRDGEPDDHRLTLALASEAERRGPSFRGILISSGAVYGTGPARSIRAFRETDPLAPTSEYGRHRVEVEEAFRSAFADRLLILRVFNVTGSGEPRALVVRSLMERIVAGEDPLRLRDAEAVRDFLDVRDVATAVRQAVLKPPSWEIVNIASGEGTKIGSLARMVATTGPRHVELVLEPGGDVSVGDPSRALSWGWSPRHTLATSLRDSWSEVLSIR